MHSGETSPTDNTESNPATESENPWQKMAEEAPPFGGGEKQSNNTSETVDKKAEPDDYFTVEGVEYRNIDKIDISTNQGKYEWLDSLVENAVARAESECDNVIVEQGLYGTDKKEQEEYLEHNDAYQDAKRSLELGERQRKILENLDIDGDGGVFGALGRRINSFVKVMNRPEASQEAQEAAYENWYAATQLHSLLSGEVSRRNPDSLMRSETRGTEQETDAIDIVGAMDQMDAERDALEKNLEVVEKERQRRIDWEKSHYGYVEGEGRAPISVLAAEEDMNRLRSKIIQKEKDADLLYKIYKENGKDQSLSSIEAQSIITKMIQDRDAKMAAIDEEIEKVEKKSERWRQLKQERAEIYRTVPDDAAERVMKLFN